MDKIVVPTLRYCQYYSDEMRPSDADHLLSLVNKPEIQKWMASLGLFNSVGDAIDFIELFKVAERNGRGLLRAIRCDSCSKMIGFIGLCDLSFAPSVFYALSPDAWGQGIATEMVKRITAYLHGINKPIVRAIADKNNLHSVRVLERNGFIYDNVEKEYLHFASKSTMT